MNQQHNSYNNNDQSQSSSQLSPLTSILESSQCTIQDLSSFTEDVNDVAFDSTNRLAVATGSDIVIYDNIGGTWQRLHTLPRSHLGTINKVAWAPVELGPMIASCSDDGTVVIYKEMINQTAKAATVSWEKVVVLAESRSSIVHIAFSPRHCGLRLSAASLDGCLRLYDLATLGTSQQDPPIELQAYQYDCTCSAWNTSPFDPPMIMVAAHNTVQIYERVEQLSNASWYRQAVLPYHSDTVTTCSWSPSIGASYHTLATGDRSGIIRIFKFWPRGMSFTATSPAVCELVSSFVPAYDDQYISRPLSYDNPSSSSSQQQQQQPLSPQGSGIAIARVEFDPTGTYLVVVDWAQNTVVYTTVHGDQWARHSPVGALLDSLPPIN